MPRAYHAARAKEIPAPATEPLSGRLARATGQRAILLFFARRGGFHRSRMNPLGFSCSARRAAALLFCLLAGAGCPAASAGDVAAVLFGVPGSWGVSTAPREGFSPIAPGRWAGRLADDAEGVAPPPPAPFRLPREGNPWRGCVATTLSHRFPKMLSWLWSRTGALPEGRDDSFFFKDAQGKTRRAWLSLLDEETGLSVPLSAARRLRQGRLLSHNVGPDLGDLFLYAGSLEDGAVAWQVVVGPTEEGPLAFQGRIAAMDGRERFFALSVAVETPEGDDLAVNPHEPRDVTRAEDGVFLFRLAPTAKTVNFPSVATFALEIGPRRVPAAPPAVPFPEGALVLSPARETVEAPEGTRFRDAADVLSFLELRASGLFEDADDFAALLASLARDEAGAPRVTVADDGSCAVLLVNPDPDYETSFHPGEDTDAGRPSRLRPNRAARLLAKALASDGDVVVRAIGADDACDHSLAALRMADHPATHEAGVLRPAVRLAHAEDEFVAALARRLHAAGRKLFVCDDSPHRAFSAVAADGLVEAE